MKTEINIKIEIISQKLSEILDELTEHDEIGLCTGTSGQTLLLAYSNKYFNTDKYTEILVKLLTKTCEELQTEKFKTTFCGGLAGILWAIEHLKSKNFIEIEDDFTALREELKIMASTFWKANYFDFLHGGDGIVYYFLCSDSVDKNFINNWVEALDKSAIKKNNHCYWMTIERNDEVYNLSLAHGISSRIILLAKTVEQFPENETAKFLLNGAINFLLSCRGKHKNNSLFPGFIKAEGALEGSRLGWCYGDMGNAVALWRAGILLQNELWKNHAIEIMLHTSTRREFPINGIKDGAFCHGTAGIAHIFNRFYLETSIAEFDEARWFWLNETLEMGKMKNGLAGFKTWGGTEKDYYLESSLLEGTAGIALVLMGFLNNDVDDLAWDQCFLLS